MNSAVAAAVFLATAYLIDYLVGDPRCLPHPVRLLGTGIDRLEKMIRRIFSSPSALKAGGALILIVVAGGSLVLTVILIKAAYQLHFMVGAALEIYLLFSVIAGGDLRSHVKRVNLDLQQADLQKARLSVALLVSRDTAGLEESGIARAALESLFENSADGLVAPLLFAAVGGPAAAVFYKAVNTLDSMIGYKTERYRDLGYFAAKTDDLLNYIPARLTALMIIMAGALQGRWQNGWKTLAADRHMHESPNSAWPEAAAAGVLGVSFGGSDFFQGRLVDRPLINATGRQPLQEDICRGLELFRKTSFIAISFVIITAYFLRSWEALSF